MLPRGQTHIIFNEFTVLFPNLSILFLFFLIISWFWTKGFLSDPSFLEIEDPFLFLFYKWKIKRKFWQTSIRNIKLISRVLRISFFNLNHSELTLSPSIQLSFNSIVNLATLLRRSLLRFLKSDNVVAFTFTWEQIKSYIRIWLVNSKLVIESTEWINCFLEFATQNLTMWKSLKKNWSPCHLGDK